MNEENKETLDSETQDVSGDDNAEETSSENETADESNLESNEEIEKTRQIAADQKRRAEKAERELKELKARLNSKSEPQKSEGQKEVKTSGDTLTKEEAILFAKGFTEAEVERIKSIAKIEGESPLVSAESDYFKIWKEKEDKKRETQDTQLGASRGSAKIKPKKTVNSPGLSRDEHKALVLEAMGR
jgi:hypothetical protein